MNEYRTVKFPNSRVATFDVGRIGGRKHLITGLLEIDVTEARNRIRTHIKNGRNISFISWLIKCVAETVVRDPSVQAINKGRVKQIVFNDVDVSIPLEREVEGIKVPLAALIKGADKKSIEEINTETAAFRNQKVDSEEDFVLGNEGSGRRNRLFFNMPGWMRMLVWKTLLGNPFIRKKNMGTVIITNAGMTGGTSGWIIPRTMHNLAVGIGTVNKRPWVVKGEICIRDIMHLTVLFDHDAVDGAPAARFTSRLTRNIEKGRWLD